MILIDTHILIWADQEPEIIGKKTQAIIQEHWQKGEIAISSISFWEAQMLQNKGRISVDVPITQWRLALLDDGLKEIPVSSDIGILGANLDIHGDPADRLILATAVIYQIPLITVDTKLLKWHGSIDIINAKK